MTKPAYIAWCCRPRRNYGFSNSHRNIYRMPYFEDNLRTLQRNIVGLQIKHKLVYVHKMLFNARILWCSYTRQAMLLNWETVPLLNNDYNHIYQKPPAFSNKTCERLKIESGSDLLSLKQMFHGIPIASAWVGFANHPQPLRMRQGFEICERSLTIPLKL